MRTQLLKAMLESGKTVTDLAQALGASEMAINHHLFSKGDMRFSAAGVLANALGLKWEPPKLVEVAQKQMTDDEIEALKAK